MVQTDDSLQGEKETKNKKETCSVYIRGAEIERVNSSGFLAVNITEKQRRSAHIGQPRHTRQGGNTKMCGRQRNFRETNPTAK